MSGWSAAVTAIVEALNAAGQMGFNYQQADKNRKLQTWATRAAHQIEVEDLRKAGLNPILSATGGGGASGMSGSAASAPQIGNAATSALQAQLLSKQIDQVEAAARKTDTEEKLLRKDLPLAGAQEKILNKSLSPLIDSSAKGLTDFGKILKDSRKDAELLTVKGIEKGVSTAKGLYEGTKNIFKNVESKIGSWFK